MTEEWIQAPSRSGGALAWLDGLGTVIGNISGAAVSAAGSYVAVKNTLKGPASGDLTPVHGVTDLQSAPSKLPWIWIGGGLAVALVAVLLLRKR